MFDLPAPFYFGVKSASVLEIKELLKELRLEEGSLSFFFLIVSGVETLFPSDSTG